MSRKRPRKPVPLRQRILELGVSLLIIGILAAIAIPQLLGAREKARTSTVDNVYVALNGEIANELDSVANGLTTSTGQSTTWTDADAAEPATEAAFPAPREPRAEVDTPDRRLVIHEGEMRLAAARPREVLAEAERIVTAVGGHVDSLRGKRIVLRIPVALFEETLDRVAALGRVLERAVSAEDVTRRHRALGLRLDTARATRGRLVTLLARAESESERLSLLSELRRVGRTIADLEAEIERLADAAAFSRLVLVVEPLPTARRAPELVMLAGFGWIHALDPFEARVAERGAPLELATPAGMVALPRPSGRAARRGPWRAEAADGTSLRTARFANEPHGDSAFWSEAIELRVADGFTEHDRERVAGWELLRFMGPEEPAYRYVVAVRASGDVLELAEVLYPDAEAESRHSGAVRDALVAGGLS